MDAFDPVGQNSIINKQSRKKITYLLKPTTPPGV